MTRWLTLGWILAALQAPALDRYVSLDGGNEPPFTNWAMAATDLLTAVNWANTNNAGDTVWVSNGTHTVSVPVILRNVTVRGLSTAAMDVVVSGAGATQCFILQNAGARLSFLTVSNGYSAVMANWRGGGITIETGTVSDAVIGWSYAVTGGGVMLRGAGVDAARLERCVIAYNTANTYGGGVGFINAGGGTIQDCTVISNRVTSTSGRGGGISTYATSKDVDILDCLVSENTCADDGGGLYMDTTGTGLVWNCTIISNRANGNGYGGGLNISSPATNVNVRNCHVRDNTADVGGGMAVLAGAIRNCLVAGNSGSNAISGGGGIYYRYSSVHENCTVVANTAVRGSATYAGSNDGTNSLFYNNIFYHNVNTSGAYTNEVDGTINVDQFFHCVATRALSASQNNLKDNPLLADVPGRDYRLQPDSTCVNSGTNLEWMSEALDLDGHRRRDWASGLVDRGAYELVPAGTLLQVR